MREGFCRPMLAGSLAAEGGRGSGAGIGGMGGRDGAQQDDAAFDSWGNVILL